MASHPGDDKTLQQYLSYYYPWWRSLLKSFLYVYNNRYKEESKGKKLPEIPWEQSIKDLENRLILGPYNKEEDFLYCEYHQDLFPKEESSLLYEWNELSKSLTKMIKDSLLWTKSLKNILKEALKKINSCLINNR